MKPSASSLHRAAACPASHALPRVHSTSEAADRGNAIHAFLAKVCVFPTERGVALLGLAPDIRKTCEGIDLAALLDGLSGIRCELACAFDVETGKARVIGVNIGRQYGELRPSEIASTLDLDAKREVTGRRLIRDWKTGQDVGSVADNWQLKLQALCERSLFGEPPDAELVYIGEDGGHRVEPYPFDELDLDEAHDSLRSVLARVRAAERRAAAGETLDVSVGEHCTYCPSAPHCPAKTSLARAMLGDVEAMRNAIAAMTPVQAGEAYAKASEIEKLVKLVKDGVRDVALANGRRLPLVGGKVIDYEERTKRTLDEDAAIAALRARGVSEADIAGMYRTSKPFFYPQTRKAG